jgi:hypothetical protein
VKDLIAAAFRDDDRLRQLADNTQDDQDEKKVLPVLPILDLKRA